jgi:hypothetical protein
VLCHRSSIPFTGSGALDSRLLLRGETHAWVHSVIANILARGLLRRLYNGLESLRIKRFDAIPGGNYGRAEWMDTAGIARVQSGRFETMR